MGITGLLPFLQKSSRNTNIKEFSGGTVAIDAYCWLHKGAFACAEKLVMNEPTTIYVTYCMKYVNILISHNIKPIMVFDGQNLHSKSMTEEKRRKNRDGNRRKGIELIRAGRVAEGRNILRRAVDVTHEMALEVIRECRKRNVDCIVAPYEADAQLAYFSINDIAQVVLTEDSDLMLFGCKTVMFKMDINGNGVVIESNKLYLSMGIRSDQFTLDKFRIMCILSGCDYVESLPGIGLVKACKFVMKTTEPNLFLALDKLPANLNMWTLEVSNEYKERVLTADRTFRCQLVFNPFEKRLQPLTKPRDGEEPVGEVKDSAVAFEMALGNINPRNMKRLDDFKPGKVKLGSSIWNADYKSPKPKVTTPSILRFATTGRRISVQTPPAIKRNIQVSEDADDKNNSTDLLEIYKKPKILTPVKTQTSRYFSSNESEKSCLDCLDTNSESAATTTDDLFAEEEKILRLSLNSTPESTNPELDVSFCSQSTSESSCSRESSQVTPSRKLGLKVFQPRNSNFSSIIDKTTDTVGSECSVFFTAAPQTATVKKLRVGLKRRKPLQPAQQFSLASFGFQIRPKIEAASTGSPS